MSTPQHPGVTLVCVPITVLDAGSALADAEAARHAGGDLVEFRVDEFFDGTDARIAAVIRLAARSPLPCIVTCRPAAEGGGYDGDEAARIALFERLGTAFGPGETPPRYLDVEWSAMSRSANVRRKLRLAADHPEQVRDLKTSLIVSLHDFTGRPADLTRRLLAMRGESAARVLKVAYRCRSLRDNLELFDLLGHRDRPMIALGMGEFGLMSRVLAPKFGGFLTYAPLRPASATAPGQPTIRELLDLYRFRSIDPATKVYGVVGWPIAHSISPAVHNAAFAASDWPGVFLPMPIPGGAEDAYVSLKATLPDLVEHPRLTLCGVSVTIPHKEGLVRLARAQGWTLDAIAEQTGAANTLHVERDGDGRVVGARVLNTDAPAFADCLRPVLREGDARPVVVVGAGGSARSAAYACAEAGAPVLVAGRSRDRVEALCRSLSGLPGVVEPAEPGTLAGQAARAYVNCTPVGMAGGPDEGGLPPGVDLLRVADPGTVLVLDAVYRPRETPLMKLARTLGHPASGGDALFVAQAERQFSVWCGRPAPAGLIGRMARGALGTTA